MSFADERHANKVWTAVFGIREGDRVRVKTDVYVISKKYGAFILRAGTLGKVIRRLDDSPIVCVKIKGDTMYLLESEIELYIPEDKRR